MEDFGDTRTAGSVPTPPERRREPRSDTLHSLRRWLDAVRSSGHLEALAIADETGLLVAGAGLWHRCELLAGMAAAAAPSGVRAPCPELLGPETDVRLLPLRGATVLVCGQWHGPARTEVLDHVTRGCARILGPLPRY